MSERDLFLEALERPTPEARVAFLDEACAGQPALRAAVEALLRHHKEDGFLESPAVGVARRDGRSPDGCPAPNLDVIGEKPGDRVGRYKLLQQIGEGGVGVVFMAEQEEPIRRRVALKILKPGMDTKSVIARFESERQALAMMDHPNIAKVLDAGSTATGRPYFVMELVRGIRITDYCDQNRLPTRERLALFIQVCQAIQHAHQKGIIHRDIKPSNILVTLHDGVPVPKVIDFGIAKALDQRLSDKTFFTEFHAFIGTPAYVSPEQAEMSGLDVDTRTDIYSLGVLLYEMLTGRTPFEPHELLCSGLEGMRRTIREREPSPPSTRFRTLPEAERTTTAARRQAEPAKLTSLLRGDLDWIVLKALEKDRTRRYPTATDLAQDIRRYLDNEPVLARPPSPTYRLRKLVHRHKLIFAGAAAVAAALLIGLALSTWQLLEKNAAYRQLLQAGQEQSRLRLEAEAARRSAESVALAARRQAYAADMNLAQQALAANNLGRAQALLNRHRPAGQSQVSGLPSPVPADLRGWEWRYLWQQCRSDALFTLCQLSNEVSALSVSPDGKWVAVGESGEGGISIWDLRARREVTRFPANEAGEPLAFSPTAPVLAFWVPEGPRRPGPARQGGHVRLWDAAGRRVLRDLPLTGRLDALAFSADGTKLLAASGETEFVIWNWAQGDKRARVTIPGAPLAEGRPWFGGRMAVSRDLNLAAQALGGGRIRVLDLNSGQERWTAQAADENVTVLAFSPDGEKLASGAGFVESTVRLWDVASGRELARLEGHRTYVRALVFWPDGDKLASGSGDQTIHLWDVSGLDAGDAPSEARFRRPPRPRVAELRPAAALRGHRLEVWSLALCPDQTTLVSGSKDGVVCVWDTATVRRDRASLTLPVSARAWGFAQNGQAILTLDGQGRVSRWEGTDFQRSTPLLEVGTNTFAACFSADGVCLATAATDGVIQLWDLQRGELLRTVTAGEGRELPITFLAGANHLVTQELHGGTLREWDGATGRELRRWELSALAVPWKTVFSPDGSWLVSLSGEAAALLHDVAAGQDRRLDLSLKQVSGAAFSPGGRWLAVVSVLGVGQLWDMATVQPKATLHGFLQGAHSVAFSPDGQRLAIASNGSEAIKLWDVESLQELLTLPGQGSLFNSTSFSADGHVLASCNSQGLVHIWRAPSFEEIARLEAQGR